MLSTCAFPKYVEANEVAVGVLFLSSTLYQGVLADFIREGHFASHIRRMRMLYMDRRRILIKAIHIQMGDMFEVVGAEAGMHLAGLLPRGSNDVAVSRMAAQRGISVIPLSTCYLKPPTRGGPILLYRRTNPHQIPHRSTNIPI